MTRFGELTPMQASRFKTIIPFLLFCAVSFGQNDSLRIRQLTDSLAKHRYDSSYAFSHVQTLLELTEKPKNKAFQPLGYENYGTLFYAYGIGDSCFKYWEKARLGYEKNHDTSNWAKLERYVGVHHDVIGNIQKALPRFLKAKELYSAIGDKKGLGEVYLSIAIVYQKLGHEEEAFENHYLALQIAIDEGNGRVIGPIYNNIGSLYKDLDELDSALKYLNLAIVEQEATENYAGLGMTLHNLGTVQISQGDYRKAIETYRESVRIKGGKESGQALTSMLQIGICFTHLKEYDSARVYLKSALEQSLRDSLLQRMTESYQFLSELEEADGNYKLALEYHKEFKTLVDSFNHLNYTKELKEAESELGLDLVKDKNNELLLAQEQNERLIEKIEWNNRALVVLAIVLVIAIVFLIINRRNVQAHRLELAELNEELEANSMTLMQNNERLESLMREKNDLVSVLAHDLRSPFGKVQSIIQLFELTNDEKEKESYLQMMDNITRDGVSLITDLIDLSRLEQNQLKEEHQKRLKSFTFVDIFNRIQASFSSHLKSKNLSFHLEIDETPILNREDFCERICDNLISNAIKYSYPDGVIDIKTEVDQDYMKVCIKDNGPGFKNKDLAGLFQRFSRLSAKPTGIESSTGLGLYIAKKLAESIQGDITLESKEGESAKFCISIPLNLKNKLEA